METRERMSTEKIDLSDLICNIDQSLLEVLEVINKNGKGIAFVVDSEGLFLGVLTDGDVRRGLISTKSLKIDISTLINRHSLTAPLGTPTEDLIELLKGRQFEASIIPLISGGRIVDYFEFRAKFYAPVASPVFFEQETLNVLECLKTGWISSQGRFVSELEESFAKKYGAKYAVTTMNGTASLHLALEALGVGPGDEVIVPSLTFAACINSILYTGATPVIVDVDLDSWCVTKNNIEPFITDKTKAIMPVHLYGQVCDMDPILELARKHHLYVIEDTAEAQGAQYKGRYAGTMGHIGSFSFFGNKIMTTGEGGMVTTDDPEIYQKMKLLRDHGMRRGGERLYYHEVVGFNYRMTNLQAAIGVAQLSRIDQTLKIRSELQNDYEKALMGCSELTPQMNFSDRSKVCWLVSYIFESEHMTREEFSSKLREEGVDSRPFFYPLHLMPIYSQFASGQYPNSEYLSRVGLNFPTSLEMTSPIRSEVFQKIKRCLRRVSSHRGADVHPGHYPS
jgi:perosamine synthetase